VTSGGRTSARRPVPRPRPTARGWWRAGLALVVLVQLVVLYDPTAPSVGGLESVPGLDKLVHAGVFALVVLVGRRAGLGRLPLLLLTVVHAPVSEGVQALLLPSRTGDPWDVVADLAGCLLGWWLTRERR
jgi:VanZ family protein